MQDGQSALPQRESPTPSVVCFVPKISSTGTGRCTSCPESVVSRIANGGQSVDEFGAAELGFEFADAIQHITLEVFDDWGSRGVGCFESGECAAKMPKLIKSGCWSRKWWLLRWHRSQKEFFHCAAKSKVTAVTKGRGRLKYRQSDRDANHISGITKMGLCFEAPDLGC
jgi:hypothetical protein